MAGVDTQDMKAVLASFPNQIMEAYRLGDYVKLERPFNKIVICGMGGSAIAGMLLHDYLDISIPVIVVNDYSLPKHVDKDALVVASSYSGNTEETISCYREARKRQAQIIVLTSNGRLLQMAQGDKVQVVLIPKRLQPRNALAYGFFSILRVVENAQLIRGQEVEVQETVKALQKKGWDRMAQELAEKMHGKVPLIYASNRFSAVAYRWRTQVNENAKAMAGHHVLPELDHNEINGFEHQNAPLHCIFLSSDTNHRRVQKRVKVTKALLRDDVEVTEIGIKGKTFLTELFTALYIGDLASYYLALKYGTDPSPVPIIENLKKEMGPFL